MNELVEAIRRKADPIYQSPATGRGRKIGLYQMNIAAISFN
jgi:hypothetical protein